MTSWTAPNLSHADVRALALILDPDGCVELGEVDKILADTHNHTIAPQGKSPNPRPRPEIHRGETLNLTPRNRRKS